MNDLFQFASIVSTVVALIGIVLMTILHVVLAVAIASDVDSLHENGRQPRFLGANGWAFTALIMGLFAMTLYWAVHHSNLRDPASDRRMPGR